MKKNNAKNRKAAELVINCEGYKYVVFYKDEMIEVDLERSFVKNTKKELKKQLKDEGVGLFSRTLSVEEYWYTYGEKFYTMNVDEIKTLHKDVHKISYSEVKLASLTSLKRDGFYSEGSSEERAGSLLVEGNKEIIMVDHRYSSSSDAYKMMVKIFENQGIEL